MYADAIAHGLRPAVHPEKHEAWTQRRDPVPLLARCLIALLQLTLQARAGWNHCRFAPAFQRGMAEQFERTKVTAFHAFSFRISSPQPTSIPCGLRRCACVAWLRCRVLLHLQPPCLSVSDVQMSGVTSCAVRPARLYKACSAWANACIGLAAACRRSRPHSCTICMLRVHSLCGDGVL